MHKYDFDLFTIGAGSGGVAGSRRAATFGARVGICEDSRVGGTCVIRGCVPKKLLVYGAHVADEIQDAKGFGWTIPAASFDWPTLIAAKNKEVDRLNSVYIELLYIASSIMTHISDMLMESPYQAGGSIMRKLVISDADVMALAIRQEIGRNDESRYDHRLHGVLLVANGMSAPSRSVAQRE